MPSLRTPPAKGRIGSGRVCPRRLFRGSSRAASGLLLRKREVAQGVPLEEEVAKVRAGAVEGAKAVVAVVVVLVVLAKPVDVVLAGLAVLLLRETLRASPMSLRRLARVGRRRRPCDVVSALMSAAIFRPFW